MSLAILFGTFGVSVSAYHAAQVSAKIGSDGRGGYLSVVKGRNVHYSELDAGESYFKAVLSNTKEKTKVVSKRKFFQSKKYATTNSPEAAWKYEYLSAYLAQWFWSYRIKIDYRDNYSLDIRRIYGMTNFTMYMPL